MYCTRPVARSPSVYRAIRSPCLGAATRNASFFPQQLFSRSSGNELAPFFRLFDDFLSPRSFDLAPAFTQQTRHTQVFQPRFDVREVGDNYELRGELPGVESQNLEVEFSDPQTLIIRGRTEQEYTSNSTPTTSQPGKKVTAESEIVAAPDTQEVDDKDSEAASTYSTGSYQRPSVEDDEGAAESSSAVPAANQPTATPTESTAATTETPAAAVSEQPQQQQPRYWVSERSTGSFQRVFSFGNRINQDAVTASLKNGILSIVVPKAAAPTTKKINIE